jgi:hypothetical protein
MNEEQKQALRTVIDMLDGQMNSAPNSELADISNYLENLYQKGEF